MSVNQPRPGAANIPAAPFLFYFFLVYYSYCVGGGVVNRA